MQAFIHTTVSDIPISYRIQYDLAGNFSEIHTSFFDLPEAAKRLQSSNVPEFSRKVKNWGELLQYAVLLALEGKLTINLPADR